MLDNHIVNIRNEVDNWLLSFNNAISSKNSNKDPLTNLDKLFFEDSHWRDILALSWKIQTISGKQNIIKKLNDKILDFTARDFSIDLERTSPREVIRAGKNVIEVILKFKTKYGQCEGILRLYQDNEGSRNFKAWNFLTALSELNSSHNKKEDLYNNT